MAGLDSKGFKRKRYRDILQDMESRAQDNFGENVNLSNRSPLGIILRLVAWSLAILWQVAEKVYNAGFVDTAEGVSLDHVGKYIGIRRRLAEPATGTITIEGDDGTEVESGFKVATEDDIEFETTETVEIEGSSVDAEIKAVDPGADGNVPSGTITEIVNPTEGVDSVTNSEATEGGRDKETDAEFKARYEWSVARGGASTVDSIRASLLDEVPGVRAARVLENDTNEDAQVGADPPMPPKSIEPIVLGGESEDIAKVILDTKAAGIEPHGTETEVITDKSGYDRTIKFSYATEKDIHVDITELETTNEYPEDGDERTKDEIVKYIGGTDTDGDTQVGLTMGEDVKYKQVVSAIYEVPGVKDFELEIGIDTADSKDNISIDDIEVAECDHEDVSISHA